MVTKAKGSRPAKILTPKHEPLKPEPADGQEPITQDDLQGPAIEYTEANPAEDLAQEVSERYHKMFPGANPVSYLKALNMLTDPESIKSNYITVLKKRIEFMEKGGEAKIVDLSPLTPGNVIDIVNSWLNDWSVINPLNDMEARANLRDKLRDFQIGEAKPADPDPIHCLTDKLKNPVDISDVPDKPTDLLPDDPWMHRFAGMRCNTCVSYVQKVNEGDEPHITIGRCRKHAPTMNGYPVVYPTDWCGDHKLDENKT